MRNKNQDLEKIAISLDITPTMYQYAVDRYNGMASFLQGKGVSAEIYPQGSFRTGTVVRPMKDGREADYDIDLVCELALRKEATAPCFVKNIVGDLLKMMESMPLNLGPRKIGVGLWIMPMSQTGSVSLWMLFRAYTNLTME